MTYSIVEITSQIGAHRFGEVDAWIEWLLTDSRSLTFPETTLFFALRTERNDGHKYIPQLYKRGVRNFVVAELPQDYERRFPMSNFLKTPSPLVALQRLAERHREEFNLPVVGVTGSNGKTVVKEWIYQLLSPSLTVTRSPRSYNSQIGVPLSVWLINEHSQVGVFEAGISQPGEMDALRDIIQPTIGVMTNLGKAHQENFASMEQKGLEKLSLFKDARALVFNADDETIGSCLKMSDFHGRRVGWTRRGADAPLQIREVNKETDHTGLKYSYRGHDYSAVIPFIDEASIENAINALAASIVVVEETDKEHSDNRIAELNDGLSKLEPVAMRLEVREGINGCTIINDSYNSDLKSLDIALDFMQRRESTAAGSAAPHPVHTLILSDMLQTGLDPGTLYSDIASLVNGHRVDKIITVGHEIGRHMGLFKMEHHHFETTEALLASGFLQTLKNEVVLLKGASPFRFKDISSRMARKVHETTLEVNLNALVDNLNHYRHFLKPETKMVCMVKASAYGAGSIEVAKTLQDQGVDYLAVAVADEGVDLRSGGITGSIMIMNPEMTSFKDLFEYDLEPEVYNFHLLESLIRAAEKEGVTNFPIHIKIDTGMHRLGFNPETDIDRLVQRLKRQSAVIPRSIFSHFVGSDGKEFDDFTRHQFEVFDRASQKIQSAFSHKILRHIANTAAIERFPQYQLDMVRLGLGLYGIDPFTNKVLNNVSTLRTTILQIRDVPATDTVGYSRRGKLTRPSRIAAIPIGYADGLNRHLGRGRGYCLVNGRKAPYVGNICMDVCMIDVTDIPCREGDEAIIFGEGLPVTILSDLLDTIPYEILTSVSTRVKRVYYQD